MEEWNSEAVMTVLHLSGANDEVPVSWSKPPMGFVKINSDAAFFGNSTVASFGMCLRNDQGAFLGAKTERMCPLVQVHEGEALGVLKALRWAVELGLLNVVFELDSELVVDSIQSLRKDHSEFG